MVRLEKCILKELRSALHKTRRFIFALVALCSTASVAQGGATETAVLVEVRPKSKNVCTAHAYAVGNRKAVPLRLKDAQRASDDVEDLKNPLQLMPGTYDILVACKVRNGMLRTSSRVKVGKKDMRHRIKLQATRALVEVREDGNALTKTVVYFDHNGREIQRGFSQVLVDVPLGKLHAAVLVDDKKLLRKGFRLVGSVDFKTRSKRRTEKVLDISPGTLLVAVKNNGRKAGALGAVRAPSDAERLVEFTSNEVIELPAGTYDIVTQLDDAHDVFEKVTRKVKVRPSKQTKITSHHKTGTARLEVVFNGETYGFNTPPPPKLKLKVELFLDAARAPFNEVELVEELVLSPGRYRVRVTWLGKKLDDGGLFFAESKFKVVAGKRKKVRLLLSQSELKVQTLVGETPLSMWVSLKDTKKLMVIAKKKSDENGEARFMVKASNVVVEASLKDGKETFFAKDRTRLVPGTLQEIALVVDVGRAVVQVYEGDMAVRAGVLFFREGASEPLKRAKSGASVLLPPGRYHIEVNRKKKRWAFPVVVVTSERVMERQLVLTDATLIVEDDEDDDDIDDDDD